MSWTLPRWKRRRDPEGTHTHIRRCPPRERITITTHDTRWESHRRNQRRIDRTVRFDTTVVFVTAANRNVVEQRRPRRAAIYVQVRENRARTEIRALGRRQVFSACKVVAGLSGALGKSLLLESWHLLLLLRRRQRRERLESSLGMLLVQTTTGLLVLAVVSQDLPKIILYYIYVLV